MFSGALAYLSNFDPTPFFIPELGVTAASGEHAFNALKTADHPEQQRVLSTRSPGEAKQQGRRVTLRPGWDTGVRVWAMQRVLVSKFATPTLAARLNATGALLLVETNYWHDQFWGSCVCRRCSPTPGVNMLGELLMAMRAAHRKP